MKKHVLLLWLMATVTFAQQIDWKQENNVVWKGIVGQPEQINLLNASQVTPRTDVLNKKEKHSFPLDDLGIKSIVKNGRTCLTFPLEKDESIYGLGLQFKSVNRRGQIMRMHMDHYGNTDNGRTHAPTPFFISSKGYGVLINSIRYIDFWLGTAVRLDSENPPEAKDRTSDPSWTSQPYSDNIEVLIPADGVEVIVFAGKDMLDVVANYNLYCGGGFIPPKWGLGFWHRTPTKYSDTDVEKEVAQFKERNFPLDVIGLEPGWHSKSYPCSFDWDQQRFPEPDNFIKRLEKEEGVRLNLWANPYIAPETSLYNTLKPYFGTHTVWCGAVPDFSIAKARDLFSKHITEQQIMKGVSGYKIDEVDGFDNWLWPDVAQFPSGMDGEQMRSVLANMAMDVIDKAYRGQNLRSYNLVRAANVGSVRLPNVIYSDNYSHREFVTGVVTCGFNGVLWVPEVRASRNGEEWVRRIQTSCFSPIAMINAWADGTKPWSFEEVYEASKEAAYLRMQLLPYLYSTFALYYSQGLPPFRAMNLVEGFDGKVERLRTKLDSETNPYETTVIKEIKDQYMMGSAILVAPLFEGEKERDVVLPKGNWYDFYTGELVGNGRVVHIKGELNKIPLFVRDGSIIPMIPPIRQTSQWKGQPLELRVYGEADGSFDLYDDDGLTYDFEKGVYSIKRLSIQNGKTKVEDIISKGGWSYAKKVNWKMMLHK